MERVCLNPSLSTCRLRVVSDEKGPERPSLPIDVRGDPTGVHSLQVSQTLSPLTCPHEESLRQLSTVLQPSTGVLPGPWYLLLFGEVGLCLPLSRRVESGESGQGRRSHVVDH